MIPTTQSGAGPVTAAGAGYPALAGQDNPYLGTQPSSTYSDLAEQPIQYALNAGTQAPVFAPPPAMYPPPTTAYVQQKPLWFPVTRKMHPLWQLLAMLVYSAAMIGSIFGIARVFSDSYSSVYYQGNVFTYADGQAQYENIVLLCVLVLLVVPGVSLLAGTFFGGWRGLLVSILSIGGSAYLINNAHLSLFKGFPQAGLLELLPFALSALIVGWIYSSRKYAAWWLSWFVQMLGAFVLLLYTYCVCDSRQYAWYKLYQF
jgi:hypothetical protein